jgi:CRISPR-associated protein Cas2
MMKAILIYDITCDRVRAKVADACLDYALSRIQYSAFFGEISANHLEELLIRIKRLVGNSPALVEVFPVCAKDLRLRRTLTVARLRPPRRPGRPPALPPPAEEEKEETSPTTVIAAPAPRPRRQPRTRVRGAQQ